MFRDAYPELERNRERIHRELTCASPSAPHCRSMEDLKAHFIPV
jgi:hypothetical protein